MFKTVNRLWMFSWADYEAAALYLEQMAAKGLLLSGVRGFPMIKSIGMIAAFEKGRPQKRKYSIDIFPGKGEEEAAHYLQMAADSGWEVIDAINGVGFFQSAEGAEPVPLQTDWRLQCREIRRGCWRGEGTFGLATLGLLYLSFKFGIGVTSLFLAPSLNSLFLAAGLLFGILSLARILLYTAESGIALWRDKPMRSKSLKAAKLWGGLYSLLAAAFACLWLCEFGSLYFQAAMEGSMVVRLCSIYLMIGLAGLAFINRLAIYNERKTLKIIGVLLEITVGIALLTYCASGCEIT